MSRELSVTYYMHSGFSCALDKVLLVFDYWLGEHGELPERERITPEVLQQYDSVVVFISHSHPDHYDPEVYRWRKELPGLAITYVVSYDLPVGVRGRRMSPGDQLELSDGLKVRAYGSTDLGVSYLVELQGLRIFHAGDLNFWHWREESTLQEIEDAESAFRTACGPIERQAREGGAFDLAFFPVDPRQGRLYDAGANYFIMSVKPRLLIPMHFWERTEIATEFARRSRSRQTEVIAMTRPGETIVLSFEEDGYMTVTLPPLPEQPPEEFVPPSYDGPDPFEDSDLPVKLEEE